MHNEKYSINHTLRQSDKTLLPIAAARKNTLNLWSNGVSNRAVQKQEEAT
jgi:hypothetical protein